MEPSKLEPSKRQDSSSLRPLIEAALFASPEPVPVRQLARALLQEEGFILELIEKIVAEYDRPEHGVFVRKVRGGYHFGTKPENSDVLHDILRGLHPPAPLSLAALQTLAIVAYRQPISASEIQVIRQVEGAGVLQTLLKRKLIAPAGRKADAGHALLYKTTSLFLIEFGLKDLKELPALSEFGELRERYER